MHRHDPAAPEQPGSSPAVEPPIQGRPGETREDAGPHLLDISGWDSKEAVRAAAHRQLHADLVGAAVGRLGKIAVFMGLTLAAYLAGMALLVPRNLVASYGLSSAAGQSLLAAIALSAALYGVTRLRGIRPQSVTDLGYAYLFLVSLLLGVLRHSAPSGPAELVRHVSPVVLPVIAFGALIPAAPRKSLAVSIGAAMMDPLAFFLVHGRSDPVAGYVVFLFASPLLAALVAYQISRVVHRLSEGIVTARQVGSYRLVERLGVGGMAEVWRAHHRMLARPAAVKLIRPEVLIDHGPRDSERLLRLFTREAQATASLSSPHTIQVYDFGITREGAFYSVMELLEGIDLQRLVESFGPQPPERVAYLLEQACQSLREAHDRNFVHRDVKPANIFTCRVGGEYDFVKVLDFGLVLDRHPTPEELEDERHFVGTPSVMAPEMVRFQAPVDARADIYALGCVAYWLLTGKRVFEAQTRHDMLVMHAHQKPVPPSARIRVPVDPALEAVVMSCLDKNPNRRPQTARELGETLGALRFELAWTEERARLWWTQRGIAGGPA